ncbi:MAG: CsgG/HfaB family protein [Proteobacteria bacterium]|nr:CsgG/HfaB family protein [Pseudomonadota bacterium]
MKKWFLLVSLCVVLVSFSIGFAGEKPRLGVLRFTNNTSAGWWSGSTGTDLQDMLIAELAAMKSFSVLERKELDAVIGEQNLGASGRVSKQFKSQMGKLKGAQYLVAATVSSFEEDTSGTDGGINIKGISLGGKRDKAYMAVDLKLIDVETGEIADVRTVEATAKSGGLNVGLSKGFFSGNLGKYSKTPTGKAIRACVMEIGDYLECSLVKGKDNKCMKAFEAKEGKRREKTKGSIDLE